MVLLVGFCFLAKRSKVRDLMLLLVFLVKFLLLENYMLSPYIILVSNRLVG